MNKSDIAARGALLQLSVNLFGGLSVSDVSFNHMGGSDVIGFKVGDKASEIRAIFRVQYNGFELMSFRTIYGGQRFYTFTDGKTQLNMEGVPA